MLGVGISPHPLLEIARQSTKGFTALADLQENTEATILVELNQIRVIRTKTKGEQMAFLSVTDTQKNSMLLCFQKPLCVSKISFKKEDFIIYWKIQNRNNHLQMILNHIQEASSERLWLLLPNHLHDNEISEILSQYPGNIPVILHYQDSKQTLQSQRHLVQRTTELIEALSSYTLKTIYQ